jgi:hypothetical protein
MTMSTSRICNKLRTKRMFVSPAGEALDQTKQEAMNSSHCWCNCTLTETGPDDRPVGFEVCNPSRPCFEE